MPYQTVYTSGTGMLGMEKKLNTISHNLANLETTGFKKQRCNFEDLFYDNLRYPGSQDPAGEFTATGIAIGVGTRVTSVQSQFNQGAFKETGRKLDVAVAGNGFLRCVDPYTNQVFYSRAGNLSVNNNGSLVIGSAQTGRVVDPVIQIPPDAIDVQIGEDGQVFIIQGETAQLQNIGQIQLTTFVNPEGLLRMGENMYQETDASGPPTDGNPGAPGYGQLKQQMLEMSNVSPVTELIDMITTQRAYELNSQVTRTGDQCLQTVISIKR